MVVTVFNTQLKWTPTGSNGIHLLDPVKSFFVIYNGNNHLDQQRYSASITTHNLRDFDSQVLTNTNSWQLISEPVKIPI